MKKKSFPTFIKMLKKVNESDEGFTLIDMMVTLSLFALLTTVLISSYPDSATKVELANAVSDVQGVVRDSQLRAGTIDSSTDGTTGGYGLYFDPATTTSFFQFKDTVTATSTNPTLLSGNNLFDGVTELAKTVTVPEGFYLRNICVANSSARPFPTATCTRTNPSLGTVSVVFNKMSSQPYIYVGNSTTTRYLAACAEFASVKSLGEGKVKSMVISQSGFSTTALGACDEAPISLALNTGDGPGGVTGIISGTAPNSSDKTSPVITLNGSSALSVAKGAVYTELGATAFDNIDGNITSKISAGVDTFTYATTSTGCKSACSMINVTVAATTIDTSRVGTYSKHYRVSDSAGNKTAVFRTITIAAPASGVPTVTLLGGNPLLAWLGSLISDPWGTAYDTVDGDITNTLATTTMTFMSGGTPDWNYQMGGLIASTFQNASYSVALNKIVAFFSDVIYLYDANDITASPTLYSNVNSNPADITIDSSDNLYIINSTSKTLIKITPSGTQSTIAALPGVPSSLSLNAQGNFYMLINAGQVGAYAIKVTQAGVVSTVGTVAYATAVTAAPDGTVYTVNNNESYSSYGVITKIDINGTQTTYTIPAAYIGHSTYCTYNCLVAKIRTDSQGNVYTVSSNYLMKMTPAGSISEISQGVMNREYNVVVDLAVDPADSVYAFDAAAHGTYEFRQNGTEITHWGSYRRYFYNGEKLFVDSLGFVYVSSASGFYKLDPNNITPGAAGDNVYITSPSYGGSYDRILNWGNFAPFVVDSSGNIFTIYTPSSTLGVLKISPSGASSIFASLNTSLVSAFDAQGNKYQAGYYPQTRTGNPNNTIVTKATASGATTNIPVTLPSDCSNSGTYVDFNGIAVAKDGTIYVTCYASPSGASKTTLFTLSQSGTLTFVKAFPVGSSGTMVLVGFDPAENLIMRGSSPSGTVGDLQIMNKFGSWTNLAGTSGTTPFGVDGNNSIYSLSPLPVGGGVTLYTGSSSKKPLSRKKVDGTVDFPSVSTFTSDSQIIGSVPCFFTSASLANFSCFKSHPFSFTVDSVQLVNPVDVFSLSSSAVGDFTVGYKATNSKGAVGLATRTINVKSSTVISTSSLGLPVPTSVGGITYDAAGNMYVSNMSSSTVTKVTPSGVTSLLGSTGSSPTAVALDSAGNVYTTNMWSNNITKITPGGVSSTFATVTGYPVALTIDAADNIYVASMYASGSGLSKITPGGTVSVVDTLGYDYGTAVAIDSQGNIYWTIYNTRKLRKITPSGVASTVTTTGGGPASIAIDSADTVYVANVTGNSVTKVTSSGVVTTIATGVRPVAIVADSSDNVYTVNQSYGDVTKITPSGQAYTFKLDGFAAGPNMFYKKSGTAGVSGSLYLWSVVPNQMVQLKVD